jgi:hypothetical protein
MPNLTSIPRQSLFQTTLRSPINAVQTSGIILSDVIDFTPSGVFYLSILDPSNPEVISCTGQNSSGELTGVTRGLELADGVAGVATAHGAGVTIVLSDPFQVYEDIQTAVNSKIDETGGTLTGLLDFSGSGRIQVPVFADDTARDAAIPSPANGLLVYNTADGEFQAYQSGAWASVASGSTQPNASETVAGKVELATQSEANAGTVTGGTGASLVVTPDKLAVINQNQPQTSAITTGSGGVYVATLTPAPTSLVAGFTIRIKANHANSGSATLNVNSLGAVNIKKPLGENLEGGEIQVDGCYILIYDGTNFNILNPNIAPNKGDLVVGRGSGDVTTLSAGSNNQTVVYDSVETKGVKTDWKNQLLLLDYDGVTVSGTTARTNLATVAIPANMLRGKAIQFELYVSDFDNGLSDVFNLFVRYGTTDLIGYGRPTGSAATNRIINISGLLLGDTTNNQKAILEYEEKTNSSSTTVNEYIKSIGTATEDSTTLLNFTIDAQFGDAVGSNLTVAYIIIKLIG